MTDETKAAELYRRYRPQSFKDVIGQPDAVRALNEMGRRKVIPHALLFTGPSGVGKTTIARILRKKLKCIGTDFIEVNAADARGIDAIRNIRSQMGLAPMKGKCRIWLIDEAHQLTSDAMSVLLKMLEDCPSHVYFMLATTDPQKLKPTIITRCTELKLRALASSELEELIDKTTTAEGAQVDDDVREKIADAADGSARKALVLLHSVIGMDSVEAQLTFIEKKSVKAAAIDLCRVLMNGKSSWGDVTKILKTVDDEPEALRWAVLGYCRAVMLKAKNKRAAAIIQSFRDHFYDSKHAGLIVACYEVFHGE